MDGMLIFHPQTSPTGRAAALMSFILADACVVTVNSANDVYERS